MFYCIILQVTDTTKWGALFMKFNYMICPVEHLGVTAWSHVQCKPNPVFIWRAWDLPFNLTLPIVCLPTTSHRSNVENCNCSSDISQKFGGRHTYSISLSC